MNTFELILGYAQTVASLVVWILCFITASYMDESYKNARGYGGDGVRWWLKHFKIMMVLLVFGLISITLFCIGGPINILDRYWRYLNLNDTWTAILIMGSIAGAIFGMGTSLCGIMYIRGFYQYKRDKVQHERNEAQRSAV